jgi:hypothetical protein
MTESQRKTMVSREAKALVDALRASNERAGRGGAPRLTDSDYSNLQRVVARKLRRRAA